MRVRAIVRHESLDLAVQLRSECVSAVFKTQRQDTQHVSELSSVKVLGAHVGGVGFTRDLGDLDQPPIHLVL